MNNDKVKKLVMQLQNPKTLRRFLFSLPAATQASATAGRCFVLIVIVIL